MDKFISLKLLETMNDKETFNNTIKGLNIPITDIKLSLMNELLNKYMKECKSIGIGTYTDALFNIYNPIPIYQLYISTEYNHEPVLIGTKEEIISYLSNNSYSDIDVDRDSHKEYKDIKLENSNLYYNNNWRVCSIITFSDGKIWNAHYEPITEYSSLLLDRFDVSYSIYNTDDVNKMSKYQKGEYVTL